MDHDSSYHGHRPIDRVLLDLGKGNRRFAQDRPRRANTSQELRLSLMRSQHPPVAVLACADSRVAPEYLLDRGLGELFVVRVAGNIVNDAVLGSLEYAVDHLGVAVILVMGHSHSGAVTGACSCSSEDLAEAGPVLRAIAPAVDEARLNCLSSDALVDTAARLNVSAQTQALLASPLIQHAVSEEKLLIQGAWYDMATGLIVWI